jgi:hypothetical protein
LNVHLSFLSHGPKCIHPFPNVSYLVLRVESTSLVKNNISNHPKPKNAWEPDGEPRTHPGDSPGGFARDFALGITRSEAAEKSWKALSFAWVI